MINKLCKEAYENAKEHGWHDEEITFGEIIALIHSELSEALEEYRKGYKFNDVYLSENGKPEGIAVELADAIIRIFDFCGKEGIDLEKIIELKMDYNSTRDYKHGGKKI